MTFQRKNHLLAVDVGLHTGLALFSEEPQLIWYRSHHLASPQKLKKMLAKLLRDTPRPTHIYLEGGGPLAELWLHEADKLALNIKQIAAERWRERLLYARQQTSGHQAKKEADGLARQVIVALGGKKPTQLRHDTAEAILVGLYGLLELGWLSAWPINGT
ncbi:MAG: hypothetical protein JXQ81_05575 [Desulfuromonadales bacterium]|nr:hypothetical protein [Desulfuromonadales bacterium]